MDARLINPVVLSMQHVLETVSGMATEIGKPELKRETAARGAVTGMFKLAGEVNGTMSVTFSADCILAVVSAMFGEEMTEVNDDIKDAVGEISNMICGQASQKFTTDGRNVTATMQEVRIGDGHTIEHGADEPVVAVPVKTEKGDIVIEICFS